MSVIIKHVSDFHCEFWDFNKFEKLFEKYFPIHEDDHKTILCCSGDMGMFEKYNSTYKPLFNYLSKRFKAIIVIPGNHTYYHSYMWNREDEFFKDKKIPKNVHYLENDYKIIEDIVFAGCCLWTNFDHNDPLAIFHAKRSMNDFQLIKKRSSEMTADYGCIINNNKLTPEDTIYKFNESIDYIKSLYDVFSDKLFVVVTHHVPSEQSVLEQYKGDLLNTAYFSDLEDFIIDRERIKLWLCGHMHQTMEYKIGETIVSHNALGYHAVDINKKFNPHKVFKL